MKFNLYDKRGLTAQIVLLYRAPSNLFRYKAVCWLPIDKITRQAKAGSRTLYTSYLKWSSHVNVDNSHEWFVYISLWPRFWDSWIPCIHETALILYSVGDISVNWHRYFLLFYLREIWTDYYCHGQLSSVLKVPV